MSRNLHGTSAYTAVKYIHVREIFRKHLGIVRTLAQKYPAIRTYVYLDLYAGPGTGEYGPGSPLIFLDEARCLSLPVRALFMEQNKERATALAALTGDAALCLRGDCADMALPWLSNVVREARASRVWTRGMIFADPNGELDWDLLEDLLAICPYLDMLLYYSANMRKRIRKNGRTHQHDELATLLDRLGKAHWFVRDLAGHKEWTFLFGTNFAAQDAIKKIGFFSRDSARGQAIFRAANFTKAERAILPIPGQLPLGEW